jgi:hypothetical protein
MSTKLNAQELAAKRAIDTLWSGPLIYNYALAIREVAQPIADQRDELLQIVMDIMATPVPDSSYHWLSDNGFTDKINAIVDKCTPKP